MVQLMAKEVQAAKVVRSVKSVPPLPTVAKARYPPKAPMAVPRMAALLSYLGTLEYCSLWYIASLLRINQVRLVCGIFIQKAGLKKAKKHA